MIEMVAKVIRIRLEVVGCGLERNLTQL